MKGQVISMLSPFKQTSLSMAIKREVAYGIVQGISDLWQDEELRDLTVEAGHTKFSCHRFILGACSGFFRGLFRSGMKESETQVVTLQNISSDTFKLVLEALYKGHGVLTDDNVIDIWHAVHQLQIKFMIQECEHFVIRHLSLKNYEEIFHSAKLLSPSFVLENVLCFIKKNYEIFTKTDTFLGLVFDEIHLLIGGQDLVVKSEDVVMESILRWMEFRDKKMNQILDESVSKEMLTRNNGMASHSLSATSLLANSMHQEINKHKKKQHKRLLDGKQAKKERESGQEMLDFDRDLNSQTTLVQDQLQSENDHTKSCLSDTTDRTGTIVDLLSAARTCLATTECLEKIMNQNIIIENREAREILMKALLYKLQLDKRHGQWPSAAVHRDDSTMDHIAVVPVLKEGSEYEEESNDEDVGLKKKKTLSAIRVYSFNQKKWYKISQLKIPENVKDIQFTVYENTLCCFWFYNTELYYARFQNGNWAIEKLRTFPDSNMSLVTIDSYIYILNYETNQHIRFEITSKQIKEMKTLPEKTVIEHATKFEKRILIFYSKTSEGVDETVIHCYDTEEDEWSRLNNLQGPAIKLTTFKDDHHTYVLQTNGDVWKVVKPQSDVVDFEYVTKLWGCDWTMHGAVTHLGTLYIYGDHSADHANDVQVKHSVPGVFTEIMYMESGVNGCTAFIPATITKGSLINLV